MEFRYTHSSNGGLGDIYATDGKKVHISWGSMKPDPEIEARNNRFPGGSYDFDKPYQRIGFIYNPLSKDAWKYFIPSKGKGLTAPGLARINRSIEAFVYCILGAQVNTRSSIVGISGSAQETRQEFLVLFESAIIENDIPKSIQRYQLAVQQAKVRLDFAISPGCWLFPSNLVINTGSVPGYNNKLQRVTNDMKFGINDVNQELHKTIPHFVGPPRNERIQSKHTPVAPKKQRELIPKKLRNYSIFNGKNQLVFKIENEDDLHNKVVNYIRRFYPDVILIAGLGEQQDTSSKRINSWRKGYTKGQPDIIIGNDHKHYSGFCIEFKTPKGTGVTSEAQKDLLEKYKRNGYKILMSNDYDLITREIAADYCLGIRIRCPYCCKKFVKDATLNAHLRGFHRISP